MLKACRQASASCHHHNIPSRGELLLIEAVNLPNAPTNSIAHNRTTQLFAHGNTHPIGAGVILPGIKHQAGIAVAGGGVEPAENMIKFQRFGEFHKPSLLNFTKGAPLSEAPGQQLPLK